MPELEAKFPRPRERTLGGDGGGGGPTMEAKGSESDEELRFREPACFVLPLEGFECESLPFVPSDSFLESVAISVEDDAEGDLRR